MGYMGLTAQERWALERALRALRAIPFRPGQPMCLSRLLDKADECMEEALIVDEIVFKSVLAIHVRKAATDALRRGGSGLAGLQAEVYEFWRMVPGLVTKALEDDDWVERLT